MIGIVDYGASNLLSLRKSLEYLGAECRIIKTRNDFNGIKRLILPGVGAFQTAINNLRSCEMEDIVHNWIIDNKPFFGICLGLQILFEASEEARGVKGFGIFKGQSIAFKEHKIPQIGWNRLNIRCKSKILNKIKDHSFFYFLHSYYVKPEDSDLTVATTEYGVEYTSVIEKGNIYAVQFHPEKSSRLGLHLLKNWIRLC